MLLATVADEQDEFEQAGYRAGLADDIYTCVRTTERKQQLSKHPLGTRCPLRNPVLKFLTWCLGA